MQPGDLPATQAADRWAAATISREDDIYATNRTEHKARIAGGLTFDSIRSILLPLIFGVLLFLRVLGDPHSQVIRGLDMFRLIGVGFLWCIACAALLWLIVIEPRFRK